ALSLHDCLLPIAYCRTSCGVLATLLLQFRPTLVSALNGRQVSRACTPTGARMTVDTPTLLNPGVSRRAFEFSRVVRTVGYIAVVTAMAVAVGTFFVLMGLTPIAPTEAVILTVLVLNGALALVLILVIGWEIGSLVLARQRGRAAARLHIRIVGLFSIVAATPAILVAVVASVTLDRGLDNWFSTNTQAIVENSANIATAFVDAQAQSLDAEITGLKHELERGRALLVESPERFQSFLAEVTRGRGLPGVFLVK